MSAGINIHAWMDGGMNLIVREWLNGGLVPLNIFLLAAIGYSLLDAKWRYGREYSTHPGVAAASAFWWIFVADGMRAGLVWWTLRTQNRGGSIAPIDIALTYGYVIAAIVAMLAILRCIYLATPKSVGHWGWLVACLSTVVFVVISHLI